MNSTTSRRNSAVFIDLENMFGGYSSDVSGVPLSRMLREIRQFVESLNIGSSAATTKAYANWMVSGMSTYRREMLENGVEPVQIFSYTGSGKNPNEGRRKNAADVQIVVDALSVAVEAPWVDVFVIVSGDGDYIPLVRRLQFLGKYVIGVTLTGAGAGGVNALLRANVDHYFEVDAGVSALVLEDTKSPPKISPDSDKAPQMTRLPSDRIPTLREYAQSAKDHVARDVRIMRGGEVDGAILGAALRAQWPRVNWATFGFKSLGDLIAKECGLDIYRPISAKGTTAKASPTVVDGVSASANVIQAETAASLRKALEAVEPAIGYPELISLTSALDELTVRSDAMEPDALLDALGDSLPDVPAEQIRLALGLLYAVGAFRVKDDSSLILTSDIKSAENGIDFILGDARRRAETIEIEPTDSEIEEAVFGR